MDNITHSLIGAATAKLCERFTPQPKSLSARWTMAACLLGNNAPDLDIALQIFWPHKIYYLLHHRGHSHTLLFAPILAGLIAGLLWFISFYQRRTFTHAQTFYLFVLSFISVLTHILADGANVYGVHPFWPWDKSWYYGDSIFILEPLLWLSLGIPLAIGAKSNWPRAFYCLPLFLLGILVVSTSYLSWPLKITLLGFATTLALFSWKFQKQAHGISAVVTVAIVLGLIEMRALAKAQLPPNQAWENILSPLPANPFCWHWISIEKSEQSYVAHSARYAPFPRLVKAKDCPDLRRSDQITASLFKNLTDSEQVIWYGSFRSSFAEMKQNFSGCWGRAFLRFARAPFWATTPQGMVLGDLRFDREKELGFAEVPLPPSDEECPSPVPDWREPRSELLEAMGL